MLVNLSQKTVDFLRDAQAAWPDLKALPKLVRSIRGSGAVRVSNGPQGIVVHVDHGRPPSASETGSRPVKFLISSSTLISANVWKYRGKMAYLKAFPASGASGLTNVWAAYADAVDVDLINEAELGNTGTTAGGVTIDSKFTGVAAVTGIVLATPHDYADGSTVKRVWSFYKPNLPTISCT